MDDDIQTLQKFFKRAGIKKKIAKKYAEQLNDRDITIDDLLDDSNILNGGAGEDISTGDKVKMQELLEIGTAWMELFKRIGIVDTVYKEYTTTFLLQGMTREMLYGLTDEGLQKLEVDGFGDRVKILKAAKLYLYIVPCSGSITHQDVMGVIKDNACIWNSENDKDRMLLQEAASLVLKTPISDGVLEIEGESMHVFFEVGSKENHYKVYLENGVPKSTCMSGRRGKTTVMAASKKTTYGGSDRVAIGAIGGGVAGGLAGASLGFVTTGPIGAIFGGIGGAIVGGFIGAGAGAVCDRIMGPSPMMSIEHKMLAITDTPDNIERLMASMLSMEY